MKDINDINIRLVDSTILLVFLATMRHRKTTAVASEMRLTQPAVSHALKRLRNLFDDPLRIFLIYQNHKLLMLLIPFSCPINLLLNFFLPHLPLPSMIIAI